MSGLTKIEWTDHNWNPLRGCSRVSPGCQNCYAEAMAARFSKPGLWGHGVADEKGWTGKVVLAPEKTLTAPLRWRTPRRIFVNSTSDLFHESVPDEWIDRVFAVMALAPQHTFQVLTKRAERMRGYLSNRRVRRFQWGKWAAAAQDALEGKRRPVEDVQAHVGSRDPGGPLPNVHLGVSAEDQARADERIPHLLQTPAAVRFVSCEPLLGPINLAGYMDGSLRWTMRDEFPPMSLVRWTIIGGESGHHARPCDVEWIRSLVRQCREASVPCFVKQLGANRIEDGCVDPGHTASFDRVRNRKGGDPSEWPEDLRVREFPEVTP